MWDAFKVNYFAADGIWFSFRVGGNQTIAPKENRPRLELVFGLGLVLGLGVNFP